ncbi:type II secretion system F family protein [Amnibacterium setariae]|uniref:Type II secretion system protein F n=1 Tax=Amnibacterium setariae TaxID=2306585 RepID=A0A3A1U9Q7_9MICO|nr:type II secretion system F family protein [Amnibacterium setariae]RIX30979.1 type II secretion system protein F [Amnibacterium setariae]
MIPLLGAVGGAGLVLVASPWLWPRTGRVARPSTGIGAAIEDRLDRAGFPRTSPAAFATTSLVLGVAAAALVLAMTGLAAVAVLALLVAAATPWAVAGWRARSRQRAVRMLWPEVVDHLVAAIRAGMPLPDALAALATSGPAPLRSGFQRFEERWRRTGTVGPALDELKRVFADPTADRLIEVLRMAREVGGTELPSVLRDLAAHLRQDLALRAEVEARQGWVVSAGRLGVAAPWIVLALLCTRPEAARAYATPQGTLLLLAAAVVTLVAYRVMLAIGRLPEDRRWFR